MCLSPAPRLQKFFTIVFFFSIFFTTTQAQKGNKNITVGAVISIPLENTLYNFGELGTGFGIEATGQQYISNKSALLLQANFINYNTSSGGFYYDSGFSRMGHHAVYAIKAGYQFQFSKSGVLLNALPGLEFESDFDLTTCLTFGVGKRFQIKKAYFIDAGIDYLASSFNNRINIKAASSIFRRPKPEGYDLW